MEDVLSIYKKEKPLGVIAQFGGQTPLNLSAELEKYGVKILGTSPAVIDMAEDRDLFRAMMDKLQIPMPEAGMAVDVDEALAIAERIGYPVMVRPSYVLGGRGMEVVYDPESLTNLHGSSRRCDTGPSDPDRPFPASCNGVRGRCDQRRRHMLTYRLLWSISSLPVYIPETPHASFRPDTFPKKTVKTIKEYTKKIAEEMHVKGLMNMQYAIEDGVVYVLEANPRASRTVPLVSKVCAISYGTAGNRDHHF